MPQRRTQLVAIKPSDQAVTNSAVLVAETALAVPCPANVVMNVKWRILVTYVSSEGIQFAVTFPAGATVLATASAIPVSGTMVTQAGQQTASGSAVLNTICGGGGTQAVVDIEAAVTNGATPGTVTLEFAQSVAAGATSTTVKAGSSVVAST
jgi:hypothetical protein